MRRIVDEINDEADIYHPVVEADIRCVESRLGFAFPESYRQFVRTPDIATMKRVPDMFWFVDHPWVGILDKNASLRRGDFRPYPEYLIAFASNGCGDYFCFHRDTGKIVYIDPDYSIEENLASKDGLVYDSFEEWLGHYLKRRPSGGSAQG